MAPRSARQSALTKKHIARLERERQQTRMIVWGAALIVAIVLGLIAYSVINENVIKPGQAVARVGDDKVTSRQFQARVRLQREQIIQQYAQYYQYSQMFGMDFSAQLQQFQDQLADYSAETLGQGVLDSMINELLMLQEAKELDITVTEDEVQERMQAVFGFFPNGEPTATITPTEVTLPTISAEQAAIVTITPTPGTPTATPTLTATIAPTLDLTTTATATIEQTATATFTATATLTATAIPTKTGTPAPTSTPEPTETPITQAGFDEKFAETVKSFGELGFSEADYRKLVELDLIRQRIFEHVTADVKPFQEQVWARHILVDDEETANTVYERLMDGEDFAVVAAEVSTDTSNKDQGGDLGWFGKGAMVAPFEEAAFRQKVGQVGKPIQSDFGWHIIQVIGHEDRPLSAEQFDQAKQDAFAKWIEELRAKAEEAGLIEIFDIWKTRVPLEPTLESAFGQQQ